MIAVFIEIQRQGKILSPMRLCSGKMWKTNVKNIFSYDFPHWPVGVKSYHVVLKLLRNSRWDKWQDKVSFCSLIRFNWRVPARVPLFSLGLKVSRSPCGHSGRLSEVVLTHYRRREVRNSIYRYRKIYIDYRLKFSYRFISSILIIYGNTNLQCISTGDTAVLH